MAYLTVSANIRQPGQLAGWPGSVGRAPGWPTLGHPEVGCLTAC
jgi:hypothetical protein